MTALHLGVAPGVILTSTGREAVNVLADALRTTLNERQQEAWQRPHDKGGTDMLAALVEALDGLNATPDAVIENDDIKCPACGKFDTIECIDIAVRPNRTELNTDDGDDPVLYINEGEMNFQTEGYLCAACLAPVSLPSDVEVEWP